MQKSILYERSATLPSIHGHFRRSRVETALSKALKCSLTTVTAGVGWGKTQAVSAFLHQEKRNIVWQRVSELDNITPHFWESFSYAVSARIPRLSDALAFSGFPNSMPLFHDFLRVWGDVTAGMEELIMVFDDLHLIHEPAILHFIENLLCARLSNLSVILIGRNTPQLELQGFYTDHSICRITEEDLRFTPEETAGYFESLGIFISSEEAEGIFSKTEGWISAIYLVGVSLLKDGGLAKNAQSALIIAKRQIFELIERDIFSGYSRELKDVLIQLACLENIPADIIKEHFKYSLSQLEEIEKRNLFIRFNPVTENYEIHHLFLEFLLEKQEYLSGDEILSVHEKIGDWHYAHGSEIDALNHYHRCGNYEKIWRIISSYEIAIPLDVAEYFLRLIEDFPDEFVEGNPLVSVVRARLHLNNGKVEQSEAEFLRIIAECERFPDFPEKRAVAGEAYIFMALISMLSLDERYVEYFKKAYDYLPGGSVLVDRRLNFSDGNFMILIQDPSPGAIQRHMDAVMEALSYGCKVMNGAAYGVRYVTKAEAAYYTCDMKEAEASAYKAIYQAEQSVQYDTIFAAYFVLLRVYISAGRYDKADECMTKVMAKLEDHKRATRVSHCVMTRDVMFGWYYSRIGATNKVPDWIFRKEKRDQVVLPNNFGRDQFVRAYCFLKDENYLELSALLDTLDDYYNFRNLLLGQLQVQIYKAIVEHKTGDLRKSMLALQKAYDLAKGNELYMQFIEMGKYMRAVIYAARRSEYNTTPEEWLDEIYTKSMTYEKHLTHVNSQYAKASGSPAGKEPHMLTAREREIVRHLCQGLTGKEIAACLYISPSTVKKKLNSLYDKLGATNRADAVRIAIQMGLDQ